MNGNRYLLDTNAIVSLLQQKNSKLNNILYNAEWIGVSVISCLEFLMFPGLSDADKSIFDKFLNRVEIVNLDYEDENLIKTVITLRKKYSIKLPDAIIAGSAYTFNAKLITGDKQLFKINEIETCSY